MGKGTLEPASKSSRPRWGGRKGGDKDGKQSSRRFGFVLLAFGLSLGIGKAVAEEWIELSPPGLDRHSAVYDPVNQRMVLYGGETPGGITDQVYALDLDAGHELWTHLFPSGVAPRPRVGHRAVYDPVNQRMVVFAGYDDYNLLNDTWAMTLEPGNETWAQLYPSGAPPSTRYNYGAVYDSLNHRVVVFGGWNGTSYPQDVWALDLAGLAWIQLYPSGTSPPGRTAVRAIYDPVNQRMVLFGGHDDWMFYNDVWTLDLTTGSEAWIELYPAGTPPSPRGANAAIYDTPNRRMIVYAGWMWDGAHHYYNDVWSLDLTGGAEVWTELHPSGPSPIARRCPTAVYDALNERMIAYGGNRAGGRIFGDTYVLEIGMVGVEEEKTAGQSEDSDAPVLLQSHPNPLTRETVIEYGLPVAGQVSLSIHNASGQLVTLLVDARKERGKYSVAWDGTDKSGHALSSGSYFCRLELDGQVRASKMVILK